MKLKGTEILGVSTGVQLGAMLNWDLGVMLKLFVLFNVIVQCYHITGGCWNMCLLDQQPSLSLFVCVSMWCGGTRPHTGLPFELVVVREVMVTFGFSSVDPCMETSLPPPTGIQGSLGQVFLLLFSTSCICFVT